MISVIKKLIGMARTINVGVVLGRLGQVDLDSPNKVSSHLKE
jgi:hypothetical protein